MSNDNEQIEARLCSYIDDELAADERARIEQYLARNPDHRQLVEEMRRTRAILQGLRHEAAPPEIVEAVQGQIERSLLLNEDDGRSVILRIGRWPQFAAAAAMLLLAFGLAYIVVKMLPRMHPVEVAIPTRPAVDSPAPSAPSADPRLPAPIATASDNSTEALRGKDIKEIAPPDASVFTNPADQGLVTEKDLDRARRLFQDDPNAILAQVEQSVPRRNNNGMVVVILNTARPDEANGAALGYLRDNNIPWREPAEPVSDSTDIAKPQSAFGLRINSAGTDFNAPAGVKSASATNPSPAEDEQQVAARNREPGQRIETQDNPPVAGQAPGNAEGRPGEKALETLDKQTRQQVRSEQNYQRMFVARDLTAAQVADLTQSLRRQSAGKSQVFADINSLAIVESGPSTPALRKQESQQASGERWVAIGSALEGREDGPSRRTHRQDMAKGSDLGKDGGGSGLLASRPAGVDASDKLAESEERRKAVQNSNAEAIAMAATIPATLPATQADLEATANLDVIIVVQSDAPVAVITPPPTPVSPTTQPATLPAATSTTRSVDAADPADFKPAD